MKTRTVLILITLLCAAVASLQSARADTITVTNTKDSGPGSLRQALVDANDGDTINFDSSLDGQKITLTSGQLNVDKDVTISGPGAHNLAVDGNAQSRVFYVNAGKIVSIDGLTVGNGYSDLGGAIYNDGATLTITNSTLDGNAADSGGGIFNGYGGPMGSSFVSVSNSTISGNSAHFGGGISNSAFVTVSNCTISGNSASAGGGIYNYGVFHSIAGLSVNSSTVSGNSATGNGGGIYNIAQPGGGAALDIIDSILNAGSSGENIFNDGGTVTSDGYNLSSDDGGGFLTGSGDQTNTDPLLGPLQDNGDPTFTHALLPGSPAVNAGDPSFTPPPFFDQRGSGFDRVVNGRIDIGSFEVQTQIDLQASGRKLGGINTVRLTWSGAISANIDVYRNGALVVTANDGSYRDSTGEAGRARYTYRVCEAGTETCSNSARVTFRQ